MNIKNIICEEINKFDVEIQQYIDVIDLDPDNPRYDKYKNLLKQKFNVDYVRPEVRYKQEIDVINNLVGIDINTKTKKGLQINIKSKKSDGVLKSLTLIATTNNDNIAHMGFNIDLETKQLRIGGAKVKDEYQRQGVYTELIKIVVDIAKKYGLKISEDGRSADAQQFWDNSDLQVVNEEILDEILNLLEGVGDKYAEKQFNIPDQDNIYDRETQPAIRDAGMGELVGYTRIGYTDSKKTDPNSPIYKNPQSLKNFEKYVRAFSDDKGNLYVGQVNGDYTHDGFEIVLGINSLSIYDIDYGLTWNRVNTTNKFGLSDSDVHYAKEYKSEYIKELFKDRLEAVKTKNPQFEFIPEIYNNLQEGYSSYEEKQQFEKQYQDHLKDSNTDTQNGTLVGLVKDKDDNYLTSNIYKNPKSLKNFEKGVRAIGDEQGNIYVAQLNGEFFHVDMAQVVLRNINAAIELYRIDDTNMFGSSAAGGYLAKLPIYWGGTDATQEALNIIKNNPKTFAMFQKINDNNPDLIISVLPASVLRTAGYHQQTIDQSVFKTKQVQQQQKTEYFEEHLDEKGYKQNVDTIQTQDPMILNNISVGIREEVLYEDFVQNRLYGYHCTNCNNLQNIETQGIKVGERSMQGKGVYAFYNLENNSAGNAALGYGQRHIGQEFCVVKFEVKYPQRLMILVKRIAEEVLGNEADIIKQIEKHFGEWNTYWQRIKSTLKPEYQNEESENKFKIKLQQDFDKDYDGNNLMFGTANMEGLNRHGVIYNGEYGIQYLIKTESLISPIGYHKVSETNGSINVSEFKPFTAKADKLQQEINTNPKYDVLKPYADDIEDVQDLILYKNNLILKQNQVRNNRDYDELDNNIKLLQELIDDN